MANAKTHKEECGTCVSCGLRFKDVEEHFNHKEQCSGYIVRNACMVLKCPSNSTTTDEVVPTFPLPDDIRLRKMWLDVIPYGLKTVYGGFVCIKHFSNDDLIKDEKGITLKSKAIPGGFTILLRQDKEVVQCCIPGCTSNKNNLNLNAEASKPVRTFPFPKEFQSQKNAWVTTIYNKYLILISVGSVCALHFKQDDIIKSDECWFLKHAVVPSVFDTKDDKSDVEVVIESEDISNTNSLNVEKASNSKFDNSLKCCVPTCSMVAKPGIGFHTFPKKNSLIVELLYKKTQTQIGNSGVISDLRKIWLDRVGLKDASDMSVICTKHFVKNDYIKGNFYCQIGIGRDGSLKLIKLAVPTQKLPKPYEPCFVLAVSKERLQCKDANQMTDSTFELNNQDIPCSITYCNSHLLNLPKRTLYKLPKDITRANQWADICGYPQWLYQGLKVARETVRICSLHFSEDIIISPGRLKFNAMPSIFDPLTIPDPPLEKDVVDRISDDETFDNIVEQIPTIVLDKFQSAFPTTASTTPGIYVKCAVASCDNYFDESRPEYLGQSYFSFPEEPEQRLAWIKAINKPIDWDPSHSRICFRHFHGVFVKDGKILKNAVPALYLQSKTEAFPMVKNVMVSAEKMANKPTKLESSKLAKSCVMVSLPFQKTDTKTSDSKMDDGDVTEKRKKLKKTRGRPRMKFVTTNKPKGKVGRPRVHPIKPNNNKNPRKVGRPRKKLPVEVNIDDNVEENEISDFAWKVETQIEEYESDFCLNRHVEEEECNVEKPCDIRDQPQLMIIKEEPQGPSEFEASESVLHEESYFPPLKKIKLEPQSDDVKNDDTFVKTTENMVIPTEQIQCNGFHSDSQFHKETVNDHAEEFISNQTKPLSETQVLNGDKGICIAEKINDNIENSSEELNYVPSNKDNTLFITNPGKKLIVQQLNKLDNVNKNEENVVNESTKIDQIIVQNRKCEDFLSTQNLVLNRNLSSPIIEDGICKNLEFVLPESKSTVDEVNLNQMSNTIDKEFDSFIDTIKMEFKKLNNSEKQIFMHKMRSKLDGIIKTKC